MPRPAMTKPAARTTRQSRLTLFSALLGAQAMLLAAGLASLPGCETMQSVAQELTPAPADPSPAMVVFKSEPEIRVRIARGASGKKVSGPPKIVVRQTGTSGKSKILKTPLTVSTSSTGIEVTEAGGAKHLWPHGVYLE